MKKKKILIFSAHPDDIETGMGGTAKRLIDAGHEVISIATTLPAPDKTYEGFEGSAVDVRKAEGRAAHQLLGIEPEFFAVSTELNFPVTEYERDLFKGLIKKHKPDVVFTQWGSDVNPDHRSLFMLSIEPCLQKGVNIELFTYEVFSEPGRPQSLGFYPTHYVNIDSVLETKEKMVRCHKSQLPNLWDGNMEMQKIRGMEAMRIPQDEGMLAEAFIRLTRYGNLDSELAQILQPTPYHLPRGMGVKVNPKKIGLE